MDALKKLFPHAFKANDLKAMLISIVIYILIDVVCGLIIGLLEKIPVIGIIFGLIGSLIGLYAFAGIVLSILVFFGVFKK